MDVVNIQQATLSPSSTSLYRVNNSLGNACILIRTDGLLSIKYRNKLKDDIEADVFLPDYPELTGDCVQEDFESLTMSFKGFTLKMYFRKVRFRLEGKC